MDDAHKAYPNCEGCIEHIEQLKAYQAVAVALQKQNQQLESDSELLNGLIEILADNSLSARQSAREDQPCFLVYWNYLRTETQVTATTWREAIAAAVAKFRSEK